MAADRRMPEAGRGQQGRCPQRAGRGDDDLRRPDDEPPRPLASGPSIAGRGVRPERVALDADRAAVLDQHPRRPGPARTIRAPAAWAAARWARIPDCLVPRRQPNGQLPQSPQSVALRRVGAASQPSAAAPRRIASSFGGMTVGRRDPELRLDRGDVGVPRRPGRCPRGRGRAAHSARTHSGAGRLVIQLTTVPPPTALPDSIVIDAVPGREQAVVEVHAADTRRARRAASSPRRRTALPRGRRPSGRRRRAPRRSRRRPHPSPRRRRRPRGASARPAARPRTAAGPAGSTRDPAGPAGRPARSRSRRAAGSAVVLARIGVGEERQELAEAVERRPAEGDRRFGPGEQVALARRPATSTEGDRAVRARAVFSDAATGRARRTRRNWSDLGRVGRSLERLDGQPRPPERVAPDERLGQLGEGRDLGVGPA